MTQRTPLGFLIAEAPDSGRDWKKRKEYGAQIEHPELSNGSVTNSLQNLLSAT